MSSSRMFLFVCVAQRPDGSRPHFTVKATSPQLGRMYAQEMVKKTSENIPGLEFIGVEKILKLARREDIVCE